MSDSLEYSEDLDEIEEARDAEKCLRRCANICLVAGAIMVAALIAVPATSEPEYYRGNIFEPLFAWSWTSSALAGGILLLRRRRVGRIPAWICYGTLCLGLGLGTLFGILGFKWLSRCEHLLE
jgi:hypothetical protein